MSDKIDQLPTLLVIASTNEEDWIELCSQYSSKFRVVQTTWDKIALSSYSDSKFPLVEIGPNNDPIYEDQKKVIGNIKPSLVLIRNMVRYLGSGLGNTPDYRNILYGFYHANIPTINDLYAVLAESEKPIMYGRLRKIRDKVGEKNFPLIKQYYYPEFSQICITPECPYVLKVSFPHAGFGKIRVKDHHDIEDLKSIIALHKDYCAMEPLIDVDYELRIVFVAPNYYRVHKRESMNWKVNFGMTNIREDCEMTERWKKWVDLIYENYPDMLTFDIDALVDKNGKEYILEVNGSSQGFAPEHGRQDLEHMRDLVVRKLEVILGINLLNEDNEAKKLFNDSKDEIKNSKEELSKDTQIVNLKNQLDDYRKQIEYSKIKYNKMLEKIKEMQKEQDEENYEIFSKRNIGIVCIIIMIISILFFILKH